MLAIKSDYDNMARKKGVAWHRNKSSVTFSGAFPSLHIYMNMTHRSMQSRASGGPILISYCTCFISSSFRENRRRSSARSESGNANAYFPSEKSRKFEFPAEKRLPENDRSSLLPHPVASGGGCDDGRFRSSRTVRADQRPRRRGPGVDLHWQRSLAVLQVDLLRQGLRQVGMLSEANVGNINPAHPNQITLKGRRPNGFLGLSLNDRIILFLVILLDNTVSVR